MPETSPPVSIHIVTYNSRMHLPTCFDALVKQTFPNIQIMVVDNASVDGCVTWMEEYYPHIHVLRNTRNLGFSRAHNQALRLTQSPYVLVLNPDVMIEPDWIARGVDFLEHHPTYASFGGVLMRYTYSADELSTPTLSDIIDSTGLLGSRSRHFVDRGSGEHQRGQFDQAGDVFGHSGACVLFRRAALEKVRWQNEYFDDDFFLYKEDIDLAWRLQRAGWTSWYDPLARGYHHRHLQGLSKSSDALLAKNHRSRTKFLAWHSYRNHWLMLLKLETRPTFWRDAPMILWYEWKKFLFLLFTQPSTLRALGAVIRLSPTIRKKRLAIRHQTTCSNTVIRQLFFLRRS